MPQLDPPDSPATAHFLDSVLETMGSAVLVFTADGTLRLVNQAAERLLGRDAENLFGCPFPALLEADATDGESLAFSKVEHLLDCGPELAVLDDAGVPIPVSFNASPLHAPDGRLEGVVCVCSDMREKKQLELELRHAHKLESVGALAAGIAHEINTPIQFIGDSVSFLKDAFEDLKEVLTQARALEQAAPGQQAAATAELARCVREADLDFLFEEIPDAIGRVNDGVGRVADIVRAIKVFAHPGQAEPAACDLNEAVRTTLIVARNEYKYVARVEVDLDEIPEVHCNQGDLGQVVLNLLVNAAHAISDRRGEADDLGTIRISTRLRGDRVVLEVGDDGAGIPDELRGRIFDPFFTTKEPGRGTGQGLAILHRLVAQKYGGSIDFDSLVGRGTTFRVALPVSSAQSYGGRVEG